MRRLLGRSRHFDCLDPKEDDARSQIEGANLFRNHSMRGYRSLAIVFFTHESRPFSKDFVHCLWEILLSKQLRGSASNSRSPQTFT